MLKKALNPTLKSVSTKKREYLTELIAVTTDLSLAILFPYLSLFELFILLPQLNKRTRRVFFKGDSLGKSICFKNYLTIRFSRLLHNYSDD